MAELPVTRTRASIEAAARPDPELARAIAQRLTTAQRNQSITGDPSISPEELLAAGYQFVGGKWLAPSSSQTTVGPGGDPTPHLRTAQSQSAGSNLGGRIGGVSGGGVSRVAGGGGGGGAASSGVTHASALQRLLEDVQRADLTSQLGAGSNAALPQSTGGSGFERAMAPGVPAGATGATAATSPPPTGLLGSGASATLEATSSDQAIQQSNPDALALLSRLIGQGGTAATQANSGRQASGADTILQTLQGLSGLAGGATSAPLTGTLQSIARQFQEQVFPQIARGAESAGSSKDSMRALLENDALARQSEAQSKVALQAQMQAAQQQASLAAALQNLTQVDPLSQELLALLGRGAQLPTTEIRPMASSGVRLSV